MIPTRKMPSSFNYGKMTAGVGPKFQRFTGSGTINSGMANTIGGMKSGIDALRSGMPLYDAGSFNSYTPGRPSSQPIGLQYGFAGNEQESEAAQGVWNLTNSPQLQKDNYL